MRYFKATDGRFTVFRSTSSRVYASAWIQLNGERVYNYGFSAKAPPVGQYPAHEIDRAEFQALASLRRRQRPVGDSRSWVNAP